MDKINSLIKDESTRNAAFPVTAEMIYLGHAGVTALPKVAADAMTSFAQDGTRGCQETGRVMMRMVQARFLAAQLIGAQPQEIALLGPTAMGLNLVALGIPWEQGDEVVFYADDYPANVYPWSFVADRYGVQPVPLRPELPGHVTWDLVEGSLTDKTRLVALASCHYLSGYRIDVDGIGRKLRERGVFFCLDGIQTIGAFPTPLEHVDFMSADSHKWMLGPAAAGIFYVREALHDTLRPGMLGAWNVESPEFIAQEKLSFYPGARRYEPGMLNLPGIIGMAASIELLLEYGTESIAERLLQLRQCYTEMLAQRGFQLMSPIPEEAASAIITVCHPERNLHALFKALQNEKVFASLRRDRENTPYIRFSPHFYNTESETVQVAEIIDNTRA